MNNGVNIKKFYVIAGKTIQFYGHDGEREKKKGEEKKTIRHHVLQIANFFFLLYACI